MKRKAGPAAEVVRAAGGLVWRDSSRGRLIALVHRPKYDDWTFPKGKLNRSEGWQKGALREVREETGLGVRLGDFAGGCAYITGGRPKVVLYWNMELNGKQRFAPADEDEVDALEWRSAAQARRRLTYARERRVLAESLAGGARSRRKRRR
jgi:8-oxo-(d)GTP phosphatase